MKIDVSVGLLAIILVVSSMLGFVGFNIPEVKAATPSILVGGPVTSSATYGFWIGSRGNRTNTVGSNVRYTVNITDVAELWSFDFTLAWGMTVLELKTKQVRIPKNTYSDGILWNPTPLKAAETSLNEANRTAVYQLAYTQQSTAPLFNGSGCAVYLDFTVLSPGGECDVYFLDSKLSFKNGTAITHTRTDGYFYQPTKKRVPTASFTTSPATKIANKTSVTFNGAASSDPDAAGIKSYIWNFGQDKPIIPVIQSPHPCPINAKLNYTLKHTNAIRMRIFFTNITLDSGDAVRIRDKNNIVCQSFLASVGFPGIWSNWVKGDTININLTTDGDASVGWGFLTDHYNFFIQVVTSSTSYTYTILLSDYAASPYGPYPFTTSLSVIDNEDSQSRTMRSAIQVAHPRPVARFTFSPNVTHYYVGRAYIYIGKTVNFDASLSYDPDSGGGIAWYYWDFGDGTNDNKTIPTTSHTFNNRDGETPISLTVKDTSDGLLSFYDYRIYVYNMTAFAEAYGSTSGSSNYDYFYDLLYDDIIDAQDLLIMGKSYYS